MAKNWIPYTEVHDGKPTEATKSASVHRSKDQVLLIEKREKSHGDVFSVIIVDEKDHSRVIGSIGRFDDKPTAKDKALEWMDENEQGVKNNKV